MSDDEAAARARLRWTVGIFAYTVLLGAMLQARGALLASFGSTFGVGEARLGLVSTAGSAGFLLAIVVVGGLVSRLDARRFVTVGIVGMAAAAAWVAVAPSFSAVLAALVLGGLSKGVLNGLGRPMLSHLYPERRGRTFNLLDMAWAAGAAGGPLLATAALAVGDWRLAYAAIAVGFLPLAAFLVREPVPASVENERRLTLPELRALLARPSMWLFIAGMLLLSFIEGGMFTWLPYYASGFLDRSTANLALTAYLLAYVPGRYAFSVAAERLDNTDLVLGSAVVTVPLLYVAFAVVRDAALLVAVVGVGLLVAGMFPTLSAWALNRAPGFSGPVTAVALGVSAVGFLVFPPAMGAVAARYGAAAAMQTLVIATALLAAVMALGRLIGPAPETVGDAGPGPEADPDPDPEPNPVED